MRRKIEKYLAIFVSFVMVATIFVVGTPMNVKAASPRTWYVDDIPGTDGENNPPEDFIDIDSARVAANPGDTIHIYSGNYGGFCALKDDLIFEGDGMDNTFVGINDYLGSEIHGSGNTITNLYFVGDEENYWHALGIYGTGTSIVNCRFKGDYAYDLSLYSSDNTVSGNIFEGSLGVVSQCNNNIISGNTFIGKNGVSIWSSGYSLEGDTISDNTFSLVSPYAWRISISLVADKPCTISNNIMNEPITMSNQWGTMDYWNIHTIDSSNLLNGAPIYYYKDTSGGSVPLDAGQVILANCDGMVVENLDLSSYRGYITLGYSSSNVIQNIENTDINLLYSNLNTITGNTLNSNIISVVHSDNNDIEYNQGINSQINVITSSGNYVHRNTGTDMKIELSLTSTSNTADANDITGHIEVHGVDNKAVNNVLNGGFSYGVSMSGTGNLLENNVITNYEKGIRFWGNDHVITRNYLSNNDYGVYMDYSGYYGAQVYNNDFIGNTIQAYVGAGNDAVFNLPAPIGGNYWDDWTTPDTNGDGFVDSPYPNIPSGEVDDLPWTIPFSFTPSGGDVEINPDNNVSMTFDDIPDGGEGVTTVVTSETNPGEELARFKFVGYYYNITTTATFNGIINISISYDDSIVKPSKEPDLQLNHWDGTKWVDITTYVNVGDNIIYGETSSLSPFVLGYEVKPVDIDIKPGSDPNSINLGSEGNVPVGILTTTDFDATTVDPETVTLAGANVGLKGKSDKLMASIDDVDGDGDDDLMLHIDINELDLVPGSTIAVLLGETFDGTEIKGIDSVNIVPN